MRSYSPPMLQQRPEISPDHNIYQAIAIIIVLVVSTVIIYSLEVALYTHSDKKQGIPILCNNTYVYTIWLI
jgi:hypothetical protein